MRLVPVTFGLLSLAAAAAAPAYLHRAAGSEARDREDFAGTPTLRSERSVRLRARDAARHGDDPSVEGSTAFLLARRPFAAYAAGRDLFVREFTDVEGVLGRQIGRPLLEDGRTPVVPGGRVTSCAACHATPFGDAGAGPTIAKNGPSGRNTPHLFGAGLVEMIGFEIRRQLLVAGDRNGNGFVDREEAVAGRALVVPGVGGTLDFGSFGDADGDGRPDLDPVCRTSFVDASGRRLPWARGLSEPGVAGYDFEVEVFGWGHTAASRAPLASSLRGFSAAAFNVHSGLQANDPLLNAEPVGAGPVAWSLSGAAAFPSGRTPDLGLSRTPAGESLDDPDGDGVADELTAGDLDLLETFLLHHPAPAELPATSRTRRGRALLDEVGCTRCHVADWRLPAAGTDADRARRATGDRRTFALEVTGDDAGGGLRGRLRRVEHGAAVEVRGVFSDFRRHDLGPAFHQAQFDGSVARTFRTPPLWGVGSTAPYGHDGASLDLESVIRRHGGAAARESAAFAALGDEAREALLAFLRGLVLYAVDDVPCDAAPDAAPPDDDPFRAQPGRFRPTPSR